MTDKVPTGKSLGQWATYGDFGCLRLRLCSHKKKLLERAVRRTGRYAGELAREGAIAEVRSRPA